ncbi:MAG: beta-lactamase domain protein [Promethearchaeota archaeon CR_4]|nr:MAG: beta-lactamase domain protein [Candidatus Lokiarchaeota archaeon CR_4]
MAKFKKAKKLPVDNMFFGWQMGSSKHGTRVFPDIYAFDELPNLDCNTFVFKNVEGNVAIVDPGNGMSFDALLDGLKKCDVAFNNVKWIIVTHVHVDHVLGIYPALDYFTSRNIQPPEIIALGESARVIEEADVEKIFPGELGLSPKQFGVNIKPMKVRSVKEGDQLNLGDLNLQVMECPGHAEGSMCLLDPQHKILISGDVIFSGGAFGRVDFPGGSVKKLLQSIDRLAKLDFDVLLPGHMNFSRAGRREAQTALAIAKQFF